MLSLAFAPIDWWPLAPVGVALLLLAVRGRGVWPGVGLGALAGVGLFVPVLSWVRAIGADGWLGLAGSQAAFIAALGAALAIVSRLPGWPVWSATLWVAEEAVRDRIPFGGFPWGRLANIYAGSPYVPYASLGGAPLVTFAIALSGGLLAWAAVGAWRRSPVVSPSAIAAAVAVPLAGLAVPLPTGGTPVTAAAVQGSVPHPATPFATGDAPTVLANHVNATHRFADRMRGGSVPRPDFVVWPETVAGTAPYTDPTTRDVIGAAVRDVGVPVLVGANINGPGAHETRNVGIVWKPGDGPGRGAHTLYVKRHLVPFGEYVPFRDVLTRVVHRLAYASTDVPGHRPGMLALGPVRVADAICFDVADDDVIRDAVVHGGQLITVQTNNASYADTGQPQQQLAIERLRAVEHGRAVVVAATTGVTAIIAPDGRVVAEAPALDPHVLVRKVPAREALTPADRLGTVPEWVLTAVGALTLAFAAAAASRRTREAA